MKDSIDVSLPDTDLRVQLVVGGTGSDLDMMLVGEKLVAVWDKLPREDRKCIESHWETEAVANQPVIILDNPWFGDSGVRATTESRGLVVKLNWQLLVQFPEHKAEVLDVLMAHEMAHVFQWATGKNRLKLTADDLDGTIPLLPFLPLNEAGLVELHADETMMRWGFDPYSIDAWSVKYMVKDKKSGMLVPREKPLIRGAYTKGRELRMRCYYDQGRFPWGPSG